MQYIKKQFTKAAPIIERAIKWVVRTAFELLKLAGLAFMVMQLIAAAFVVEIAVAGIIVFAAIYITNKCR